MKASREPGLEQEPVGIVISSGSRKEETPRFAAYIWGPVPEESALDAAEMVAA
ncbi:MAG: hypothetical protein ACHQQ3_03665 [Gemmatimonadales bacterium]